MMEELRLSRTKRCQRLSRISAVDSMPKDGSKVDGLIELAEIAKSTHRDLRHDGLVVIQGIGIEAAVLFTPLPVYSSSLLTERAHLTKIASVRGL